jgi:hypothetical protein
MSRYITVEKYVDIEVDLEEFDNDDLVKEIERRNISFNASDSDRTLLESIYLKRRVGNDYQKELDELIYNALGKIL